MARAFSGYTWFYGTDQDTIAEWIEQLRQGDEEASRQLWERFFDRLLDVAARKIKHARTADYDEEDVVLSALKSFCLGVREGRFPRLLDRDDLWRLLFVITSRKIADRFAFLRRAKRDVAREATHPSAHSSWDTARHGLSQVNPTRLSQPSAKSNCRS